MIVTRNFKRVKHNNDESIRDKNVTCFAERETERVE